MLILFQSNSLRVPAIHKHQMILYNHNNAYNRHRERQRTLAVNARNNRNNTNQQHGLGRLEAGIGYFPSLAALQFQSSIPEPTQSVAEYENKEKERLDRILKFIGMIVLIYFLLS